MSLVARHEPLVALAAGVLCAASAPSLPACGAVCVLGPGQGGGAALRLILPDSQGIALILALPAGALAGLGTSAAHILPGMHERY